MSASPEDRALHRRLLARSAALTVLVYGGAVAAVVVFPGLLCGAWGAFLLWFYRREAGAAVRGLFRRGPMPETGPRWPLALPVQRTEP